MSKDIRDCTRNYRVHPAGILQSLLDRIERIACGEDQVADNDGDGLKYIYDLIQESKA